MLYALIYCRGDREDNEEKYSTSSCSGWPPSKAEEDGFRLSVGLDPESDFGCESMDPDDSSCFFFFFFFFFLLEGREESSEGWVTTNSGMELELRDFLENNRIWF